MVTYTHVLWSCRGPCVRYYIYYNTLICAYMLLSELVPYGNANAANPAR